MTTPTEKKSEARRNLEACFLSGHGWKTRLDEFESACVAEAMEPTTTDRTEDEFWHIGTSADEVRDEKCGQDPVSSYADEEDARSDLCDGEHVYRCRLIVERVEAKREE